MMNVQTTKMHVSNVQTVQAHVQLLQMINPTSTQTTQTCTMMKLSNKQYKTHTTIKLHGQKQSWQKIQTRCDQLSGPQTGLVIHVDFYIAGTQASSPLSNPAVYYPRKERNRLD